MLWNNMPNNEYDCRQAARSGARARIGASQRSGSVGHSTGGFDAAVRRGQLERVGRGLYGLMSRPVSAHGTLAEVARRVPKGVVCLLSALRFHDLTTQAPFEVWLAIDNKAATPKLEYPPCASSASPVRR